MVQHGQDGGPHLVGGGMFLGIHQLQLKPKGFAFALSVAEVGIWGLNNTSKMRKTREGGGWVGAWTGVLFRPSNL